MNTIPELIHDLQNGKMVILIDDENRENEGDLILAADFVSPQAINFMAVKARGLICLSLPLQQIKKLGLPLMVKDDFNLSPNKTAFTVSIEAASGVSTGISAADRAHTIRVAANPLAKSSDIIMPGHVFPIRAQDGGVLKRAGHTEASVDLARLAGLNPAAVICEIMNEDGTMARVEELRNFSAVNDIKIGTIEDLIKYRLETESFIQKGVCANFPTRWGQGFRIQMFRNELDGSQHLALIKGDISGTEPVLVRVHTENVMSDVFDCSLTESSYTLKAAMKRIDEVGRGVLLYLRTEDMGSRLEKRLNVFAAMDQGTSDNEAFKSAFSFDQRDYGVGAQILRELGLSRIVLLSNHPSRRVGIKSYGLEIVDSIRLLPLPDGPEDFNEI